MIKRLIPALALLAFPMSAEAAWGFTAHQGGSYTTRGYYMQPSANLPTLDLRMSGQVIQFDVLELISGITTDQLHLGVNYYKTLDNGDLSEGGWKGVWQLGGALDIDSAPDYSFDPLNLQLLAQARMGMQAHDKFGFGIYIVPGVGFAKTYDFVGDDAFELAVGGEVQLSAWIK